MNIQTLAALSTLYSQPHRYYHNLNHINQCLGEYENYLQAVGEEDHYKGIVIDALLWHDAVYNPYSKKNEAESANLFYGSLPSSERHWGQTEVVCTIIRATGLHTLDQNFPNLLSEKDAKSAQIVMDLDLSSLGSDCVVFRRNGENIRKEYGHIYDPEFYAARSKFLRDLANRERLFYTNYFHEKYERQARINIGNAADEAERIVERGYL